ncbi:UNVERIFIED_ORG: hypothetical protein LHK14_19830 [Roseateles sp. XES5]|nr:hypothetical protein [Roseateles sp. XES5]
MRKLIGLVGGMTLAGCTTLPELVEDDPRWVAGLSNIIQCEIYTVFSALPEEEKLDFMRWGATYTISQNAEDVAAADLNPLRWVTPARVDKFWLTGKADISRKAYRNGKAEFSVPLAYLDEKVCETAKQEKLKADPREFRLAEWVEQVSKATVVPRSFSYSVTVTVVGGAGLTPSFANGRAVADAALSYKRTTLKTIDFAFSGLPRDPAPTKVIIVGDARKAGDKITVRSKGKGKGKAKVSSEVPESIILQNRQAIQGLQLDRVSPYGLDR